MEPERLEFFRQLLQDRLQEILGEADKTRTDMTGMAASAFPDPTDRATLETDRNFTLRIRDRERKLITKIREALERIDDGSYGVCEICGGDIAEKRLIARPVTTMCIACKSQQEALERSRGV
ncbi:MAG: RNA polymerase-binding protein DksA [Deltaproteobacteria bacterium]|nr:RNA polymerase-binding protein DksA [Deltaproteobacteria bacterium]MBM4293605.1 RNA polymerase-binding protein DksA [Deltaproteobacteria bacterium]